VTRTIAILICLVVGVGTGLLAEQVPVRPVFQSIIAALGSWTVASLASAAVWLMRPSPDAGISAVSFGVGESLLTWAGFVVLAVLLHAALGWLGPILHPSVVAHRSVLIALVSSLSAALVWTSGLGVAGALG
jgi:hypothetical protein